MAFAKDMVATGLHVSQAFAIGGALVSGLTAKAGGGQAGATLLAGAVNIVAVSATAGDSVRLPPAGVGDEVWVRNNGAASSNVFPQSGGKIDNGAVDAALALAAAKTAHLKCVAAGEWIAVVSA